MEPKAASEKIVVVGFGWVGQANALALARMGYAVGFYDIITPKFHYQDTYASVYKKIITLKELTEWDNNNTWYIVCIGDRVSEEGRQDISLIEKALESLRKVKGKVILRSTVLPDYLAKLPFDMYVPEFLHELYAVEECLSPYYFVIGNRMAMAVPSFLAAWQSRAVKIFIGTPEEAAHIKYLSNIWNALRIAFVNEFGDSMGLPTTDAERQKNERVIDFFFEKKSYLRYGKTFDGHCLPKDMRAYRASKAAKLSIPLLTAIYESNKFHQKIEDQYATLPTWFSSWNYSAYQKGVTSFVKHFWKKFNTYALVHQARRTLKPTVLFVEKIFRGTSLSKLKENWNMLARRNALYYGYPDTKSGEQVDAFEVRKSGEADYKKYITDDPIVREYVGEIKDKTALEIGLGVGRVTEFLASNFGHVYATDISNEMIAVARKRLLAGPDVTLAETPGNIIPFAASQFDFIFSYLVFKYLPTAEAVREYLQEIARTLKPSGLAKVQIRTGQRPHVWHWFDGVSLTTDEANSLAQAAGLVVIKTEVENSKSLWLWLCLSASTSNAL